MRMRVALGIPAVLLLLQTPASAQAPVVKIEVARTVEAINYNPGVRTSVDLRGTELMPRATGQAKIATETGATRIEADLKGIEPSTKFGPYLTYILWAITPEGQLTNLGEIVVNKDRGKIATSTRHLSFGLIVTAEPYYAVTFPSEIVVFENVASKDTKGKTEPIQAKGELFKRGQYASLPAITIDPKDKTPIEIYQARNALAVARAAQAETFGGESWTKARSLLDTAEKLLVAEKSKDRKQAPIYARQAVQAAEDARAIAVQRAEEARIASEQKAAEEATARAQAEAEAEAARRSAAEAAAAQAQAEASTAAQDRAKAVAAAEAARRSSTELRSQLLRQFSEILPTEDTPRGLVVNLGGVNFATGKSDLSSEARERLARFSGLVAGYPGLKLEIEGHTDNVGKAESNQKLSQDRASAVRDYLVNQGVKPEAIAAKGLGDAMPVADNGTADGRAQNRRVEIVVSGEVIGKKIGQ